MRLAYRKSLHKASPPCVCIAKVAIFIHKAKGPRVFFYTILRRARPAMPGWPLPPDITQALARGHGSRQCTAPSFTYNHGPRRRDALGRHRKAPAEAIVVEVKRGPSVAAHNHIRVPVYSAAAVGMLRQRRMAVVRAVELYGAVEPREVDAVTHELGQRTAVGITPIGDEVENGGYRVVVLFGH